MEAQGVASDEKILDAAIAVTAPSNQFAVLPVMITNVDIVASNGGKSVATKLNAGENRLMIFAVTTTASTNTDSTDGSSLRTRLGTINIALDDNTTNGIAGNVIVKKIGGDDSDGVSVAAGASVSVDLATLTNDDAYIDNGTTVYYEVLVGSFTPAGIAGDESARVRLINFDLSGFLYRSDNSGGATLIQALRLPGKTTVEGVTISD